MGEGLVLADMGRRNEALVLLQNAHRVMQGTHGEAHRDTRELQQLVEELGREKKLAHKTGRATLRGVRAGAARARAAELGYAPIGEAAPGELEPQQPLPPSPPEAEVADAGNGLLLVNGELMWRCVECLTANAAEAHQCVVCQARRAPRATPSR